MSMSISSRRMLALIVGVGTLVLVAIWSIVGKDLMYDFAWRYFAQNMPLSQAGGGRPDAWDQSAHQYYSFYIDALLLVVGISAALLILVRRPTFRDRAWLYLAFLALVLPATMYNYAQRDIVLRAPLQFGLNLLLIFLATTTWRWLNRGAGCRG